ncbi:MAG: 6-carboxytetrahydropterin synthase [Lachnospiraceae bacterium]|nr:6-carboxytetrahydropterin synthase [Lachnospiraceae bacterium]
MVNQYKYKFYLNANHAIFINNVLGQMHPHTWEIMIEVLNTKDNFVQFDRVEAVISKIFEKYQDQFINTLEPFNKVNPTLENMVVHFKRMIEEEIRDYGMVLLSIEISETPSRSYIVNSYDEVEGKYLDMNKYVNDEENFIDQIVQKNKDTEEEPEEESAEEAGKTPEYDEPEFDEPEYEEAAYEEPEYEEEDYNYIEDDEDEEYSLRDKYGFYDEYEDEEDEEEEEDGPEEKPERRIRFSFGKIEELVKQVKFVFVVLVGIGSFLKLVKWHHWSGARKDFFETLRQFDSIKFEKK